MEIIKEFIKQGRPNRPGGKNSLEYITIHETGNYAKGADASAHASYLRTTNEKVSWHFTVDENCAYQHLPMEECAYHAGKREGNNRSIGIEICVNSDGNFNKAVQNTAELVRRLMRERDIPITRVVQHHYWTGKNCPQKLRVDGWDEFIKEIKEGCDMSKEQIKEIIKEYENEKKKETENKPASAWADSAFKSATNCGIMDGTNPQGAVTREMLATVLHRLGLF